MLIHAQGLGKSYGGRILFDDATFFVEPGWKVALVGPNGAGKSTLLRILAGREKASHGTLRLDDVRTHWFDQHPSIPEGTLGRDLAFGAAQAPAYLMAERDALEQRIADPSLYEQPGYEEVLERFAAVEQEIKKAASSGADPGVARLVEEMGFDAAKLDQPAAKLSGGEKTRLILARILAGAKPGDLLVLDEPTNHLDVDAIEWLEEWLQAYQGTLLVVAHDRVFLDNVCDHVLEVAQGRITAYTGNYEDYAAAKQENEERQRREHEKAQDRVQAAKDIILQYRKQKRFDGQYASKMKALDKYQSALERAPDPVLEKLGFGLGFDAVEKTGREVLRLTGLRKSYGGTTVLDGADLELSKGDRVGLVGGNGQGKTTLLNVLTGRLRQDAGTVQVAPGSKGMFFGQEHDDLDVNRTLHQELLHARPTLDERDVKALLGRFRFKPDVDLTRTVSTLSGGERQRLKLLKCILKPSNLLILDEPTNHLDLWAKDVVIDALNAYHGTVLVVSHDRHLLDAVTDATAVLEAGKITTYPGSFTQTRDLYHARKQSADVESYVVKKRFTDWTKNERYLAGQTLQFTPQQVRDSMTLRNALDQGWLEKSGAAP